MISTLRPRCLRAIGLATLGAVFAVASISATAHTLTIMRVSPGKLSAGDTATIAARFDYDATACAVKVDFGDGSDTVTTAIAASAAGTDVPLSMQHVYAQAGAYMISIVPVADKGTPKCAGGKHSNLIDVLDPSADPASK